jgi:ribosomal protein S18 acetylase RimI-like enzyme
MYIGSMSEGDLHDVVLAWNAALPHDEVSEERFRQVMLEDPNYEPESILVARGNDGSVVGLSACVARRTAKGKDGRGRKGEFRRGYLKGIFVAESEAEEAAADVLLGAAESYCREAGKEEMWVTQYAGPYLYPGIDVRYERLRETLARHGYRDRWTIEDTAVNLRDPRLAARLARARAALSPKLELLTWEPGMLPAMQRFVAEGEQPQWFPPGWESGFSEPRETALILRKGEEILGWAQYWPRQPRGSFGPILVLERLRGRGYGSILLLECMVRARERGVEQMWAGWANTPFYVANGWHIARRYAVLTKELGTEGKR